MYTNIFKQLQPIFPYHFGVAPVNYPSDFEIEEERSFDLAMVPITTNNMQMNEASHKLSSLCTSDVTAHHNVHNRDQ